MKKIFCAVLILLLFIVPHTANASGNEALYGMDFWYNNNFIMESGAIVNRDGKVMLPVKILADAMSRFTVRPRPVDVYRNERRYGACFQFE